MIKAAGGMVDYDLPPPYVGKEHGKITARDAWYITDERMPLRMYENAKEDLATPDMKEFLNRRSAAVREARENGVRERGVRAHEARVRFQSARRLALSFTAPAANRR